MRWVPSRFNACTTTETGDFLLYNSLKGTFLQVPARLRNTARTILRRDGLEVLGEPTGLLGRLVQGGYVVSEGTDEHRRARFLHEVEGRNVNSLNLILMPNENCNFRCVYCYESFARDEMEPHVVEGLKKLVQQRARRLDTLTVSWFGGEPLTAVGILGDLSESFMASCREHGVQYAASITSNGYNLSPDVAMQLLRWGVSSFQITLDGGPESHDQRRVLHGGGGTFQRIYDNLLAMRSLEGTFRVLIRVNVDAENVESTKQLLQQVQADFGADSRFVIDFHPVGQLGGANDAQLPVLCTSTPVWDLWEQVVELGLPIHSLTSKMMPHGYACYAGNPNSFVVGADGRVYKCTVAFADPRNHVGWVRPEGRLELDLDRFALWITNDESEDKTCKSCWFRPSCQGNACPLERIETGKPPCPSLKKNIQRAMKIVARHKRQRAGLASHEP